ncbi:MAG: hypothetical protein HY890_07975 [Deltaproteobacteria bacterium]|nr:hypothetical protein [Deltaproteobacteria bacterium]
MDTTSGNGKKEMDTFFAAVKEFLAVLLKEGLAGVDKKPGERSQSFLCYHCGFKAPLAEGAAMSHFENIHPMLLLTNEKFMEVFNGTIE